MYLIKINQMDKAINLDELMLNKDINKKKSQFIEREFYYKIQF